MQRRTWKLLVLAFFFLNSAEVRAQELITRSMEELSVLQSEEERAVLVFLTADWCTYCERIKNTSFRNPEIITKLNSEFYFVELDIEQEAPITLNGQEFVFKRSGEDTGVHELAEALGRIDGVLSTHTFVVLNPEWELVYQYSGMMIMGQINQFLENISTFFDK